ncbi:hypothetical protein, partial [Mesorhizobium sp.]
RRLCAVQNQLAKPGASTHESRLSAQGNRKNELQENSAQTPQILQCQSRGLAQLASQINGLRIVHG